MTGATRAAMPPKTERGNSVPNEFAQNLPRSLSRLWRASPPILRSLDTAAHDQPANRRVFRLAQPSPSARLFPRQRDAARTLRGRFAQGERIDLAPRASAGRTPSGTFQGWRERRGRLFAARGAAVRETALRGKTGDLGGTWRCVCNAGKPCGPKRSADRARRCRDRGKHPRKTRV